MCRSGKDTQELAHESSGPATGHPAQQPRALPWAAARPVTCSWWPRASRGGRPPGFPGRCFPPGPSACSPPGQPLAILQRWEARVQPSFSSCPPLGDRPPPHQAFCHEEQQRSSRNSVLPTAITKYNGALNAGSGVPRAVCVSDRTTESVRGRSAPRALPGVGTALGSVLEGP